MFTRPRSSSRHEGAGARTSAGLIAKAYGRFLELPVPVVLVVLWLFGALLLGAVAMVVYSTVVWLSAAIAPL